MGQTLGFVPRNSRAQLKHLRMKQRGALLVHQPNTDSADYKAHARSEEFPAAVGIVNALGIVLCAAVPLIVLWFVVEFAH